jgi:hypothetical protein
MTWRAGDLLGRNGEHGGAVDSSQYRLCANRHVAERNWLVVVCPVMGAVAELCTSRKLTRARPNDADIAALAAFAAAEKAKRRLVVELHELKLPIVSRDEDPSLEVDLAAHGDGAFLGQAEVFGLAGGVVSKGDEQPLARGAHTPLAGATHRYLR